LFSFAVDLLVLDTDNIPKDSDSDLDFFLLLVELDICTLHCTFVMGYGGDTARRSASLRGPSQKAHETLLPMKPWRERPVGSGGWGVLATSLI